MEISSPHRSHERVGMGSKSWEGSQYGAGRRAWGRASALGALLVTEPPPHPLADEGEHAPTLAVGDLLGLVGAADALDVGVSQGHWPST